MIGYDAGFAPIGLRATWKGNLSLLVGVALMASSIIFVCLADSNSSPPSHGIFRHDVSQNFAKKTPKEKLSFSEGRSDSHPVPNRVSSLFNVCSLGHGQERFKRFNRARD